MAHQQQSCGTSSAVEQFCRLPADVQYNICYSAAKLVTDQQPALHSLHDGDISQITNALPQDTVQNISHAIVELYRSGIQLKFTGETLSRSLLELVVWSKPAAEIVCTVFDRVVGSCLSSSGSSPLHSMSSFKEVGKLTDLQWKVGLSLSSSSCRQLMSPFITITVITVTDSSGNLTSRSMELTVAEFKKFTNSRILGAGHITSANVSDSDW